MNNVSTITAISQLEAYSVSGRF